MHEKENRLNESGSSYKSCDFHSFNFYLTFSAKYMSDSPIGEFNSLSKVKTLIFDISSSFPLQAHSPGCNHQKGTRSNKLHLINVLYQERGRCTYLRCRTIRCYRQTAPCWSTTIYHHPNQNGNSVFPYLCIRPLCWARCQRYRHVDASAMLAMSLRENCPIRLDGRCRLFRHRTLLLKANVFAANTFDFD